VRLIPVNGLEPWDQSDRRKQTMVEDNADNALWFLWYRVAANLHPPSNVITKKIRSIIAHLVLVAILNDFGAEVAAGDRSKVLLVAFAVAWVLVQHVRRPRLDLRPDYVVPQLPRGHHASTSALSLVPDGAQKPSDRLTGWKIAKRPSE